MNRTSFVRATATLAVTAAVLLGTVTGAGGASAASGDGTTRVALSAAPIRSVSVNLQTLKLGACTFGPLKTGDTLAFPNGECLSPVPVVITNGGVAGHIQVSTTPLVPADQGVPWQPVPCAPIGTATVPCPNRPAADQFLLRTSDIPSGNTLRVQGVTTTPVCDNAFHGSTDPHFTSCHVAPLEQSTEYLLLRGPTTSTDTSADWHFDLTWTAVP